MSVIGVYGSLRVLLGNVCNWCLWKFWLMIYGCIMPTCAPHLNTNVQVDHITHIANILCQPLFTVLWLYDMSWVHSMTTPCTCVSKTLSIQSKVVLELETHGSEIKKKIAVKECFTLELLAVCTLFLSFAF